VILLETEDYQLTGQLSEEGVMFLHFNYYSENFSKGVYESMLDTWSSVLEDFKSQGIKAVASLIPEHENKIRKFQVMFGLEPHAQVGNNILYRMVL
jgi:hypothetical protein